MSTAMWPAISPRRCSLPRNWRNWPVCRPLACITPMWGRAFWAARFSISNMRRCRWRACRSICWPAGRRARRALAAGGPAGADVRLAAMQRWDADIGRLPPQAVFLNRPPNVWQEHRAVVMVVGGVFLIMACLLSALLLQQRRLRRAESEARESEQRFRILVEHAPEAILVYDVDLDRFVDSEQQRAADAGHVARDLAGLRAVRPVQQRAARQPAAGADGGRTFAPGDAGRDDPCGAQYPARRRQRVSVRSADGAAADGRAAPGARRHRRHQRAQAQRAGAAGLPRPSGRPGAAAHGRAVGGRDRGAIGQPREKRFPGQHEP